MLFSQKFVESLSHQQEVKSDLIYVENDGNCHYCNRGCNFVDTDYQCYLCSDECQRAMDLGAALTSLRGWQWLKTRVQLFLLRIEILMM